VVNGITVFELDYIQAKVYWITNDNGIKKRFSMITAFILLAGWLMLKILMLIE